MEPTGHRNSQKIMFNLRKNSDVFFPMQVYSFGLLDYKISQTIAQSTCLSLTCSEKILKLMEKNYFGF